MTEDKRYQANPQVSCGDEEDGAVLFNPDTDDTTIINLSGRELWSFLETPRTVGEIAAHLVEIYRDVTDEKAVDDATQFIRGLAPDFVLELDDDD